MTTTTSVTPDSASSPSAVSPNANRVIIIGGGLAGLCAAHTVLEHGGSVLLLDKSAFLGGNSTKASSGINGTPSQAQLDARVYDSPLIFQEDMCKSYYGADENDEKAAGHKGSKNKKEKNAEPSSVGEATSIVRDMARLSGPSIDWLATQFKIDMSVLGLLGGHSRPRTHRGKDRIPGMEMTYALTVALENICKKEPQRAVIITKAEVTRLVREPLASASNSEGPASFVGAPVTGVVYRQKDAFHVARGPVIICTGGFAADYDAESGLLARFKVDALSFATTNGVHATGDGVKMGEQIGGALVDMDYVQIHPTGLVDSKDPKAMVKFLCAEALRGAGGIVVNKHGKRVMNELGRRDQCSEVLIKNEKEGNAPFRLILNAESAKEMHVHCKHYMGRGLMKEYKNGAELAKDMGISPSALKSEFNTYARNAKRGKDAFGKKLLRNYDFRMNRPLYVAVITPVVHYTMGGLKVNELTEVLEVAPNSKARAIGNCIDVKASQICEGFHAIPGLYCAGEAAGGVHGLNRLGGNSLLDCVVFGRVAGKQVTRYLLSTYLGPTSNVRMNTIMTHLSLEDAMKLPLLKPAQAAAPKRIPSASSPHSGGSTTTAPEQSAAEGGASATTTTTSTTLKKYTRAQVAKHNTEKDCWVIVDKMVLDCTKFLPDHPGGVRSITMYAGKDATKEFDMVHQRDVIERYSPETVIGEVSD